MERNKLLTITAVIMFLTILSPSIAMTNEIKSVGDLDELQSQTTYYKALNARNKAKDEVGLINQNSSNAISNNTTTGAQNMPLPKITKILGSGSILFVRLIFPDGTESTKRKGDLIPGGYRLNKVSLDEVSVSNSTGNIFILTEVGL